MHTRLGWRGALVGVLSGFMATLVVVAPADAAPARPIIEPAAAGDAGEIDQAADPIEGEYIVTLAGINAAGVNSTANDLVDEHGGDLLFTYKHSLRGFAAGLSEADALALSTDPRVAAVEENGEVHATTTQASPPWGLDRVDQRDLPLSSNYTYNATGAGVDAYILDTGIRTTHQEFGGRARVGIDTIGDGQNGNDCNGHGTHVAGTVGGTTYGVAKAAELIAVRVLDCSGSGSNAGVIAGVDWVTANRSGPSVANMSLGGGASAALDTAVRNSIAAGVTYALASGNDNADACAGSPGRTLEGITVGATDINDATASFSNFGTCVDLLAPGVGVLSARHDSDTATATLSGTSMATPHVAGTAALFLQGSPAATPAQVQSALVGQATPDRITNPHAGSPNLLLYNGSITVGTSIVIVQNSIPDSAQDFAFTCEGTGCGAFVLDDDADPTHADTFVATDLTPGTFTVTQSAVANWSLTDLTCDTGESVDLGSRRVTITLAADEQTTCTFTDRVAAITVVQDTVPNNGEDFTFRQCPGAACGGFVLDDDADPTRARSLTSEILSPGTYTITQQMPAGWQLFGLTCDTGEAIDLANGRATVTLTANEHVTCAFSNRLRPPANDDFANARVVPGTSGSVFGTNVNATKETGEPNHPANAGGHSVWYEWTAPASGSRTLSTCGSGFDTLLSVYTGNAVNSLAPIVANDDSCGLQSSVTFTAVEGTVYRIAVDGFNGASGDFAFNLSGSAPTLAIAPTTLPGGVVATPYSQTITGSGGATPITLAQTGALPSGLTFTPATGVLAGTPTAFGTFAFTITATNTAGDSSARDYAVTMAAPVDVTDPSVTVTTPAAGATYNRNAVVNADFSCSDTGSGIVSCVGTVANGEPIDTATLGSKSFTVTGTDDAGNETVVTRSYTVVDVTDPTISITSPAAGATFVRGQVVNADYACGDESGGSELASCVGPVASGAALDTATLGAHTFTVNAADNAGNLATLERTYTVVAPRCNGRAVTVMLALGDLPTAGNDIILGTAAIDTVNAGNGNDTVCALGGNDRINAGNGIDTVIGSGGNDNVTGGAGRDVLKGGAGADVLLGGAGNDTLTGGPQRDTCDGQTGNGDRQTGCEVRAGFP